MRTHFRVDVKTASFCFCDKVQGNQSHSFSKAAFFTPYLHMLTGSKSSVALVSDPIVFPLSHL